MQKRTRNRAKLDESVPPEGKLSPRSKCESRSPLDSTDGTSGPRQSRWDGGCKGGVGGGAMPPQDRGRERGLLRENEKGERVLDAPPRRLDAISVEYLPSTARESREETKVVC